MANDLLIRLLGVNAAAALAVLAVLALRKPARAVAGARAAYALWLIVPAALLASLLPPRTVPVFAPAPPVVASTAPTPPANVLARVTPKDTFPETAPPAAAHHAAVGPVPAPAQALVGVWLAGIAVSLVLLVIGQRRALAQFGRIIPDSRDPRLARAANARVGPALLGTVRPRVIVPADFETRFDAKEQALILEHERTHLVQGHAVINGLVALIGAVNWFNPLIHLGARCARVDQELACDATVMKRFPSERQTYAKALLKTQFTLATPPLGCGWPVRSASRLEERFEMLMQNAPGRLRLLAGTGAIAILTACAGLAAWAAEPPVDKAARAASPHKDAAGAAQPAPAPLSPPAEGTLQDTDPPKPIALAESQASASSPSAAAESGSAVPAPDLVAQRLAEQEAPRQLVAFDPAHFDKYVGYYELAPDAVFKITRQGDKLYSQLAGQGPVEIYPESETKFFATVVAAQISFITHGAETELVLHQNGLEQHAPRISEDAAGRIDSVRAQRIRNNAPSPGTEEAIRKWFLALEAGQPNYEDMTPALAAAARAQWPVTSQRIKTFGLLKAIIFLWVNKQGDDVYRVDFEHAQAQVTIGPLTSDGKVESRFWNAQPIVDEAANGRRRLRS